jgi:hypothetical protein
LPVTTGEIVRQVEAYEANGRKGIEEWPEKKLIASI